MLQTEFAFTLPRGHADADGNLHREGVMRLATALDEVAPLKDPRSCPNSSLSIKVSGIAAQLTATNGRFALALC